MSSAGHRPPQGVQRTAQRAVKWIEDGKAGRNFTDVGRHRAHQLANGESVSDEDVKKMKAYFARHEVDKKASGFTPGKKSKKSKGEDDDAPRKSKSTSNRRRSR